MAPGSPPLCMGVRIPIAKFSANTKGRSYARDPAVYTAAAIQRGRTMPTPVTLEDLECPETLCAWQSSRY